VPVGYKQTEVGVIPEDWQVIVFGEVLSIRHGKSQKQIESESGLYPILATGGQIGWGNSYLWDKPSVLIGRKGTINKPRYCDEPFWTVDTLFYSEIYNQADAKFTYYKFCMIDWMQYNEASGVPSLNANTIENVAVAYPQKKEQTAIANALSDVDALISELKKLIAKKQAIKTATMQQLLTGRTRLPDFSLREDSSKKGYKQSELGEIPEDWEVVSFGNLFESNILRKPIKPSTLVTFVGMQDVTENAHLSNQSVISYEKVRSGFTYFERGDVLVAKITPCFENGKGCLTQLLKTECGFGSTEFHVLRANESSDSKLIFYWSTRNVFRLDLESEMVGSAGHRRVPFSAVSDYRIPCATSKTEQTAIATILSDMDENIQALEQRLSKTLQIKQGMMQELLTGKTRLIARNLI